MRVLARDLVLRAFDLLTYLAIALKALVELLPLLAGGLFLPCETTAARLDVVAVGQARHCGPGQGLSPQQLQVDNDVGRAFDERLVVRDEEHGLPPAQNEILQPFEGFEVEVVRGLVKQIQLRLLCGKDGQL